MLKHVLRLLYFPCSWKLKAYCVPIPTTRQEADERNNSSIPQPSFLVHFPELRGNHLAKPSCFLEHERC